MATSERFFLDTDHDGHWCVIPCEKRSAWEAWLEIDPADEASWEMPDFVKRTGGAPTLVTYCDPQIA